MKRRQSMISEQSRLYIKTDLWESCSDYEEDYKAIIKQREMFRIPFGHHSPQITHRKRIVDYLKSYAAEKRISYSCLHLAVYILDIFMDNHSILPNRLHLVANACLFIVAKFEETNMNIPKFDELNAAVNNRYSLKDYRAVELIILKFFNWYLMIPTPAHYTHYFMKSLLSPSDLVNQTKSYRTLVFEIDEFIRLHLDRIIDDIHLMQQYTPSRLAASIILAARTQIGLENWTQELEQLTTYSKQELHEPVQALLRFNYMTCTGCAKTNV